MEVPFTFFINAGSGKQDVETLLAILQRLVPAERLGCLYVVRPEDDFRRVLDEAAERCVDQRGIFVAAGGDGTINAAIERVMPLNLTLGVIPLGTFNYFARMHQIPVDPEAAVQGLLDAEEQALPVCQVNGVPFVVNTSLGLHARIIAARERHTRITGRNRLVALVSGVITLLKEQYTLRAQLRLEGHPLARKATMVMATHNRLQLEAFKLDDENMPLSEKMAVVLVHPLRKRDLLNLLWRRLLGQVDEAPQLERFWARSLEIKLLRPHARVVVDGELRQLRTPLRIELIPAAIRCLVPKTREEQG